MTNVNWAIWRPVAAGLDTLINVQRHWSIDDLCDAHEVLDVKTEAEAEMDRQARRNGST